MKYCGTFKKLSSALSNMKMNPSKKIMFKHFIKYLIK